MKVSITKLPNGAVRFDYDNRAIPQFLNNPTDIEVQDCLTGKANAPGVQITYGGGRIEIAFDDMLNINGAPKPATLAETVLLLGSEVFKFGGGNGNGVADDTFKITQQPVSRSLTPPDGNVSGSAYILLSVDFNKPDATVAWVGSTDGGVTFPFGPYKNLKTWVYSTVNGPGTYRADITYQGMVYHSNTIEITE